MGAATQTRRETLHRRGVRLEAFTITWNVVEAVVAIGAGLVAGSVALVGFGVDSGIEVISAVALLWRLLRAGPGASAEETGAAEKRALYLVAATFFLLSAYVAYEAVGALFAREVPEGSAVGLALAAAPSSSCRRLPSPSRGRAGRWAARPSKPTPWRRGCAPTSR